MELKRCNNCANGAWIYEESALPGVCIYCDFLSDGSPSEWKPKVDTNHGDCDKRLLDWLKQPAEGDA